MIYWLCAQTSEMLYFFLCVNSNFIIVTATKISMLQTENITTVITMIIWIGNLITSETKTESSKTSDILEKYDNIVKASNDDRLYRGLILKNSMKILLVSDPSTKKSAASMTIGTGSLNDMRDVPGIANLVVFMLLAGTTQQKNIYEFDELVRSRGGHIALASRTEDQIFGFDVTSNRFIDTLKRFFEFFMDPLLSHKPSLKILDNAMRFVEREYFDNAQKDTHRIAELEKSLSKENHPYNHFFNGREDILYQPDNFRAEFWEEEFYLRKMFVWEKARTFHANWYSSNIMCLAVLGKESLDELEKIVVPLFKDVKNKDAKKIVYPDFHHPWGPEQMKKKIYVVPLSNDERLLRLNFPILDIRCQYETSPETYVTQLLLYEGPGSLFSILRKRRLCHKLEVEYDFAAGFGFFSIVCNLTDENSVERIDDIITLTFQYIRFLTTNGIQKEIFEDLQKVQQVTFDNYRPENNLGVLSYTVALASQLQRYPLRHILSHNYISQRWNPTLIEQFLSHFRPDNMNVTIVSKSFAKIAKKEETYYKTPYEMEIISEEDIEKWTTLQPNSEFQLLPVNEFIPTNFELFVKPKDEPAHPRIVHKSSISEIWFKQGDNLTSPNLYVEFEFLSPLPRFSPLQRSLWHILFGYLFLPLLREAIFSGRSVGFRVECETNDCGFLCGVNGFSDTLPVLLEKLFGKMTSLKNDVNEDSFEAAMKEYFHNFSNYETRDIVFRANWLTEHLRTIGSWDFDDNLKAAKTLQYNDVEKFIAKVFRRIFVRGLVHGNCTKQTAKDIASIIEKAFDSTNSHGMLLQEILRPRYVEMINGSHSIYQKIYGKNNIHGYSVYFQFNTKPSNFRDVASCLVHDFIQELCQNILPDQNEQEDEASNTKCSISQIYGQYSLTITILTKEDPRTVDLQVEKFLIDSLKNLRSMKPAEFVKLKRNLIAKFSNLSDLVHLSRRYWFEIQNRFYSFGRMKMELERLRSLTKSELISFYAEMLYVASPRRRKLAVHIFPESEEQNLSPLEWEKEIHTRTVQAIKVNDLVDFQASQISLPIISYDTVVEFELKQTIK